MGHKTLGTQQWGSEQTKKRSGKGLRKDGQNGVRKKRIGIIWKLRELRWLRREQINAQASLPSAKLPSKLLSFLKYKSNHVTLLLNISCWDAFSCPCPLPLSLFHKVNQRRHDNHSSDPCLRCTNYLPGSWLLEKNHTYPEERLPFSDSQIRLRGYIILFIL